MYMCSPDFPLSRKYFNIFCLEQKPESTFCILWPILDQPIYLFIPCVLPPLVFLLSFIKCSNISRCTLLKTRNEQVRLFRFNTVQNTMSNSSQSLFDSSGSTGSTTPSTPGKGESQESQESLSQSPMYSPMYSPSNQSGSSSRSLFGGPFSTPSSKGKGEDLLRYLVAVGPTQLSK